MSTNISTTIKRISSILLSLIMAIAMLIGLMPAMIQNSYASTGIYSDLIPVQSDDDVALTAKKVEFNDIKWYIIADDSTSDTEGTVTLLAADKIDDHLWDNGKENIYSRTKIKNYIDRLTLGSGQFAGVADAIASTELTDTNPMGASVSYTVKLFLLSDEEATRLPDRVKACPGSDWWLRTFAGPDNIQNVFAFLVRGYKLSDETISWRVGSARVQESHGVRPALRLDLSKVSYLSGSKKFVLKSQMIDVTGLDIDSSTDYISVNGSCTMKATVYPNDATDKTVVWSSSNPSVATVDSDGEVTGVSIGSATITATATNGTPVTTDDKTKTCTIYVKEATTVSGCITWDDAEDQDGIRPDQITVNLLANGDKVDSRKVTADDNWSWTFSNLPKYNRNDEEIEYTVSQDAVNSYKTTYDGYNITNGHTPATKSISVRKTWKDDNNAGKTRPKNIKVNLLADGKIIVSGRVLVADQTREASTYKLGSYPVYSHGNKIKYTVTEEPVDEYTTVAQGLSLVNTYDPSKTYVRVQKVWVDNDNQDGIRPEIVTVRLLANGTDTGETLELSETNNWTGIFMDLNKESDGGTVNYTVEEVKTKVITGTDRAGTYSSEVTGSAADGFTITNKHTPETTDISVEKVWNDENDKYGKRPDSTTVNLRANGKSIRSQKLTDGSWKYIFKDVPVYENGNKISYSVSEDNVTDYNPSIEGDADSGFTITNTHDAEKVTLSVFKVWDDEGDLEGFRPDSVEVHLLKDGKLISADNPVIINGESVTKVDPLVLNEKNVWAGSFEGLDRYENGGDTVQYDVAEKKTAVITGTDEAKTYAIEKDNRQSYSITITNKHTPLDKDVPVEVSWNDNNDREGSRPDTVGITLSADGLPYGTKYADDEGEWKLSFDDLPLYRKALKIGYTISADVPEGYTSVITGNPEEGFKVVYTFRSTYTITWENDDGSELEIDERVEYGTMPSYNGAEPTRSSMPEHYEFAGWTPDVSEVTADVTYTATYKSKPHELEKINAVEPTCTEDGHSAYWKCSVCGEIFSDKNGNSEIDEEDTVIKKLGHDYRYAGMTWTEDNSAATANFVCHNDSDHTDTADATVTSETVDSTCDNKGVSVYTAEVTYDGTKYTDSKTVGIDPKNHDWSEPKYTWSKDASICIAERTCSKCDITEIETVSSVPEVTKAATCTEKGETTYTAAFENVVFEKQIKTLEDIEALGHDWGDWNVTKEATEVAEGEEKRTCKNDASHTETRSTPVKKHEHKLVKNAALSPTCTEDGHGAYWKCSVCGEIFSDKNGNSEIDEEDTVIKKLGHAYGAWENLNASQHQRVCAHDKSHMQKENHSWDAGKVTKEATETAEGEKTYTCTVCGATKTESIPKLDPKPEPAPTPTPTKKVSGVLMARAYSKGTNTLKINWTKVENVDGYDIFFARCNEGKRTYICKKIKTVKGNKTFNFTKSKLNKHSPYKMYVKAYVVKNGKKSYVRTSPVIHAFTGGYKGRYTNPKSVSLKKKAVTLKKGKTYKISAGVTPLRKGKKLPSNHAANLRYLSSNKKIATVSKSGKITAKGKGICIMYVYSANGIWKTMKVTVR